MRWRKIEGIKVTGGYGAAIDFDQLNLVGIAIFYPDDAFNPFIQIKVRTHQLPDKLIF
ncbi:MAG: hypothetical protein ONB43_10660 [candidate division KSB1 bacterium]|nr:hypothetical protein [candidate division KSB1 bacterium]